MCHAGSGRGIAAPRGAYGDLCEPCWVRVLAVVERLLERAPRAAGGK